MAGRPSFDPGASGEGILYLVGYLPVRMAAREGEQVGEASTKLVAFTPCAAI